MNSKKLDNILEKLKLIAGSSFSIDKVSSHRDPKTKLNVKATYALRDSEKVISNYMIYSEMIIFIEGVILGISISGVDSRKKTLIKEEEDRNESIKKKLPFLLVL